MQQLLIKTFIYKVPIEQVWVALTHTAQMQIWYFPQLQQFKPVVGFRFQFDDKGSAYQKDWMVTQVIDGKRLAHSWTYKGYPGSSEVIFDLLPEGKRTKLKVTQTGLDSFPKDPHFARARFESGWEQLLGKDLQHLLEN